MQNKKKLISVAIPCFEEEENILPMYQTLIQIIKKDKKYDYEFVFADNGSTDKTKDLIIQLTLKDKKVKGVFLSRNFGPEASTQAAFDFSRGDAVVGIACDFQEPPGLIPQFIKKWEEGYEMVIGVHSKIQDNVLMTITRKIFYKIFKKISNIDIPINASGFCLFDRKPLKALQALPEKYRFFRGLRAWIGFKTAYINYERRYRLRGRSSYSFFNYINHAERGIFGFSYLVLDLMIYGGFILVIFSFIFVAWYLFMVLVIGNPIRASIPLMLTIVFFGGVQLLSVSIIGKYIQVIVEETKARPIYIVTETQNIEPAPKG
ncbi:glycosyltransferase family 2 protein [Candidatus Roizmanbacteria bacterium]|nr:glycosyltransferase family 2 protein [Candidatus Roizmanbacteria bacterium]